LLPATLQQTSSKKDSGSTNTKKIPFTQKEKAKQRKQKRNVTIAELTCLILSSGLNLLECF